MAKLTRKSYKRKKVAFAAVVLGGVALVSSGFAAFVLSANADQKNEGGIQVGTVKNGALTMKVYSYKSATSEKGDEIATGAPLTKEYFSFDADAKDVEGNKDGNGKKGDEVQNNVKYEAEEGRKPENLTNTFVIEVTSDTDSLKSFAVSMTTKGTEGFAKPVDAGFVILPDCAADGGITPITDFTKNPTYTNDTCTVKKETVEGGKRFMWTFTYTVAFKWGKRFNGKNPCYFFDNPETSAYLDEDAKTPRTAATDEGIGNCYGTIGSEDAVTLTPGWDVATDTKMIEDDINWFREKVGNSKFDITFKAIGK